MTTFTYRILPPHAEFWATVEPEEVTPMVRYLEHLRCLRTDGTVRFVSRTANEGHGFVLIEARDRTHADAIARSDPAVVEGLLRLEPHTVLTVLDGAAGSRRTMPMVPRSDLREERWPGPGQQLGL